MKVQCGAIMRLSIRCTCREISVIRHAKPIRFDRLAESGRNKPLRILVETDGNEEREVFLKFSGRPELGVEGLANELLASCLAGDLGLPVNEPLLVELTPEWIESIPEAVTRDALNKSVKIGFACVSAGTQWRPWSKGDCLTPERIPAAAAILAFDAFIENEDRRPSNSNCLVKGDEFRIIDHELAFRIRQKLFPPPEPWRLGNLQRLVEPDHHIFGAKLRCKKPDLQAVLSTWEGLTDAHFDSYLAAMPIEWGASISAMEEALTHLRSVRARIDDCFAELDRALT